MELYENLARLRKEAGLSQQDLLWYNLLTTLSNGRRSEYGNLAARGQRGQRPGRAPGGRRERAVQPIVAGDGRRKRLIPVTKSGMPLEERGGGGLRGEAAVPRLHRRPHPLRSGGGRDHSLLLPFDKVVRRLYHNPGRISSGRAGILSQESTVSAFHPPQLSVARPVPAFSVPP